PKNPRRMIDSHDGGVDITTNGGETWYWPPLPICQFYNINADNSRPYRVMGCMKDHGTASGPSNSLSSAGISLSDWYNVGGGETGAEYYWTIFAIAESPRQAGILWAGSDDGLVHVSEDGGKSWTNVTKNIPGMP